MIPDGVLSTAPNISPFVEQVNRRPFPLIDFEKGGVALNDATGGLSAKLWVLEVIGDDVTIRADDVASSVLFTRSGITKASLAFDQNMRPHVAFVDGTGAWLWWWDTVAGAMAFMSLAGTSDPCICTDEKRQSQLAASDIILAYTRANKLYYRQQRDRFATEYLLKDPINGELVSIGMNSGNRLQFKVRPST